MPRMENRPGDNLREEFAESRSRSFAGAQWVADDYVVQDGVVRPVVNGKVGDARVAVRSDRYYMPMGRPELPGEFAKLDGASPDQVLSFVRRYGLLGYATAFRTLEASGAHEVHDLECPGDPLHWILAHAKAVRLVLSLAEALDDPDRLQRLIDQLMIVSTVAGEPRKLLSYGVPRRGYHYASQAQALPFPTAKESALYIIAAILNENLTGITRELLVETQEDGSLGLTSIFAHRNLLDCIYWFTAEAVVGGYTKTCAFCGKVFVSRDPRTKYCPPQLGEGSVSSCMNRAKQRRFRSRAQQQHES